MVYDEQVIRIRNLIEGELEVLFSVINSCDISSDTYDYSDMQPKRFLITKLHEI